MTLPWAERDDRHGCCAAAMATQIACLRTDSRAACMVQVSRMEVVPMITVDQFMDIKSRHQNGQSIGSIEQSTGHSRNTVRKVLRGECQGASKNDRLGSIGNVREHLKMTV